MRDALNPNPSASVTFYQGVYKGGGDNQTGGTLYYRFGGGTWQSAALGFHADETGTSVQIWKSSVSMPSTAGTVVDYYFATTFNNRTSPTYIYYNGATATTATQSTAQANPFSFTLTTPVAAASFTVTTSTTGTLNADYTTSKLYVDELAGDAVPITITFAPGV
ncbi:MAG: hypothetical protein JHC52_08840, partial [Chthoniobacterales bacterium]|nr:hypothetical protein [Chthoniobacterales bacterium]